MTVYLFLFLAMLVSLCVSPAMAGQENAEAPVVVAKFSDKGQFPGKNLDFKTEINEKYEFYDVSGDTAKEIRRQMSSNGTKWDDGETYDALTTWEIKYRYGTSTENGRCYVSSAKTDVGIIFRYPHWTTSSGAPEKLVNRWNEYMGNLRTHENGHKDLAVQTARDISEGLSAMGSFGSCGELDKAAKALAQGKLAQLKRSQKEYDSTTRHGETQGAVFP